jgi:hypothetical protein
MDKLYIKVIDGVITEHPMKSQCVKVLYPDFDGTVIPDGIKEFIRVQQPNVIPFKIAECTYEFDGDVVTDAWAIRDKTVQEKQEYINSISPLPDGWILDQDTGVITDTNTYEEEADNWS